MVAKDAMGNIVARVGPLPASERKGTATSSASRRRQPWLSVSFESQQVGSPDFSAIGWFEPDKRCPCDVIRDRTIVAVVSRPLQVRNRTGAVACEQVVEADKRMSFGLLPCTNGKTQQGRFSERASQVSQHRNRPDARREVSDGLVKDSFGIFRALCLRAANAARIAI